MSRETKCRRGDPYHAAGRTFHEAAPYVASFIEDLNAHAARRSGRRFCVELVASGLDDAEERLLQ